VGGRGGGWLGVLRESSRMRVREREGRERTREREEKGGRERE